jgi:hypothetical protein
MYWKEERGPVADSIELSPSSQDDSRSAGKEIPHLQCKLKIQYIIMYKTAGSWVRFIAEQRPHFYILLVSDKCNIIFSSTL